MKREKFNDILQANMQAIEEFRYAAATVHDDTHHTYDGHPYSHHLSMVADAAMRYGHDVIENESDVLPVLFAAFFHDSIEDARMTDNDVPREAEKYYAGIRETPFAPFIVS